MKLWKRLLLLAIVLALTVAARLIFDPPVPARQRARTFAVSRLEGSDQKIGTKAWIQSSEARIEGDYRAPIILNLWASWCPPCIKEFPGLVKLADERRGIQVVALAVATDPADLRAFLDAQGYRAADHRLFVRYVSSDPDNFADGHYAILGFPTTLFINEEGVIERRILGAIDWQGEKTAELVYRFSLGIPVSAKDEYNELSE